ncbi:MAG TPA: sorbosone dehydrogenase family protein, partial [Burkholderiales bacterium]|nr:sorbosone dehydrogenase family protein [Burkholderiales bacterium]
MNTSTRFRLVFIALLFLNLASCGDTATLPVQAGMGKDPALPPPHHTWLPTMHVATAKGWPEGGKPSAAAGLQVNAYAMGLDHPRWLYVLPNGDVLVAETNAPPKPEDRKGVKGWVMKKVMAKAGAGTPSANRITLLRDRDGDGIAETRSVFLQGLHSPFGMVLVGDALYVANSDSIMRFHYAADATQITDAGQKIVDLPAGPINHHWTKNVIASADGKRLYVTVGSNSNVAENGMAAEENRAAILEV